MMRMKINISSIGAHNGANTTTQGRFQMLVSFNISKIKNTIGYIINPGP